MCKNDEIRTMVPSTFQDYVKSSIYIKKEKNHRFQQPQTLLQIISRIRSRFLYDLHIFSDRAHREKQNYT